MTLAAQTARSLCAALSLSWIFCTNAAQGQDSAAATRDGAAASGQLYLSAPGAAPGGENRADASGGGVIDRNTIINGQPARNLPGNVGQLVVEIVFQNWNGAKSFCTGTLVGPRQVLTAGHCGCGKAGTYEIRLSEDARNQGGPSLPVSGAPLLYDARICWGQAPFGSDLALLTLPTEIACRTTKDNENLLYVTEAKRPSIIGGTQVSGECNLAQPDANVINSLFNVVSSSDLDAVWNLRSRLTRGRSLTAVGYGLTETASFGSRLKAEIPIVSPVCEESYLASVCAPFAEMILASGVGGARPADTCGGDSGGPVFLFEGDEQKLIAVTSRAGPGPQNPADHCGGGGVYTLMGRKTVKDWLAANGVPNPPVAVKSPDGGLGSPH